MRPPGQAPDGEALRSDGLQAAPQTVAAGQARPPRRRDRAATAARCAAALMVAVGLFQMALALGAPAGRAAWGGAVSVLGPSLRAASAGAALILLLSAGVMLVRAGDLGRRLPARPVWALNLLLVLQYGANTLANLLSASMAERVFMTAASAALCLLTLIALLGRRLQRTPDQEGGA